MIILYVIAGVFIFILGFGSAVFLLLWSADSGDDSGKRYRRKYHELYRLLYQQKEQ